MMVMVLLSGRIKMSRITILPPSLLVLMVIAVGVSIFDCCNNNHQNIINNVCGITATTTTTTGVVTAFIVGHQQQQQYNSNSISKCQSKSRNVNNVLSGSNNNPLLSQERYSSYSSAVKVVSPLLSLSSDSTDGGPLSDLSSSSSSSSLSSSSSSSSGGGRSSAEEDDQWIVCSSSSSSKGNPRRRQQRRYSREMAQTILNTNDFLPSNKYSDRIGFGRIAVEKEYNNDTNENENENNKPQIMTANDPRLKMTYAEFPLSSYDILLDKAITYLSTKTKIKSKSKTAETNLVDIGSGLGRIVLYTALTRGKNGKEEEEEEKWNISGIEIISGLHDKALQLVQTGIETGIFCSSTTATTTTTTTTTTDNSNIGTVPNNNDDCNSFSFHLGSFIENNDSMETITTSTTATAIQKVLYEADLIFMYSTAFTATQFNPDPDVCALLLDGKEWSQPLSELCQNGCIVITTDKALDPYYGWKIIDRIENVPNPEVLDSTGFIHILSK